VLRPKDTAFPLAAAVLFGAGAPIAKALAADAGAQVFAGILYLGSGLGLCAARLVWRTAEEPLHRRDLRWLAMSTVSGGIVAPVLLVWGLQRTSGSAASLLLNVETMLTAAVAWLVFGEHRHARSFVGLALVVGGGVVLSLTAPEDPARTTWMGSIAVAGACLCWAIDNNVTQPISMRNPLQIAMWKGLIAGGTNLTLAIALGQRLPDAARIGGGLVLGALSYGASLTLFVASLRRMGTVRTAGFFAVAPFVGAAVAVVFWREPLTWSLSLGGLLMAAGVALYVTERHAHRHLHEREEHAHLHVHDEHHRHEHQAGDPPGEPHSHAHRHDALDHEHPHVPDIHHRHGHEP
jgi:drug/metabolite transporter (DMT)-like permease